MLFIWLQMGYICVFLKINYFSFLILIKEINELINDARNIINRPIFKVLNELLSLIINMYIYNISAAPLNNIVNLFEIIDLPLILRFYTYFNYSIYI